MRIGIKEQRKYRDLAWLMPSVDVTLTLERLGVEITHKTGDEIWACCPDHHLFLGRESSDPNWSVNTETGETFCFTEGRGSNIIWTICRLTDKTPREVEQFLVGSDTSIEGLSIKRRKIGKRNSITPSIWSERGLQDGETVRPSGLGEIQRDMESRYTTQRMYDFFMSPPGKPATNIRKETVDHYRVFERTWGFYTNRAIVPFILKGELVGFCAIDLLGKKEWMRSHPLKTEKEYKKTLYPMDSQTGGCLFGFDDCQKNADYLIITEGAREVMKLWQEGFTNAVAQLGAYLSREHHELITELNPKRVILLFDGDDAGRKATDRASEMLSRLYSGERTKRCYPPIGRDPKSMSGDELRELILKK